MLCRRERFKGKVLSMQESHGMFPRFVNSAARKVINPREASALSSRTTVERNWSML
jgi:hypothetical protein